MNDEQIDWPADLVTYSERAAYLRGLQASRATTTRDSAEPDATEQMLGRLAIQADDLRAVLDELAPHTEGNLVARVRAALTTQAPAEPEARPLFDEQFPQEGYVTDAEWQARKQRRAAAAPSTETLLDKIESYEFECQGGNLRLCQHWGQLREQLGVRGRLGEPVLWQYRWTNPGGSANQPAEMLAWKEVNPWAMGQTLGGRIKELREFTYQGKPAYEVRALYAAPAVPLEQPAGQKFTLAQIKAGNKCSYCAGQGETFHERPCSYCGGSGSGSPLSTEH